MPRGPSAHGLDPWGTRALPAPCSRQGQVWRGLVPAASHRSRPASPSDRPPGPAIGRPEDRLTPHPFGVTHWSREPLMDEHISRFKADADDPSHLPDHGVRPGFRLLLQSFLTRLL